MKKSLILFVFMAFSACAYSQSQKKDTLHQQDKVSMLNVMIYERIKKKNPDIEMNTRKCNDLVSKEINGYYEKYKKKYDKAGSFNEMVDWMLKKEGYKP